MILSLLLSLAGPAVALKPDDPPVKIELNHEEFTRGDRARVYIEAAEDGHLVVLHADPDGRVRVLFPLDPTDDDFVRGGRRVEIRSRTNRDAFFVDANDGSGTVVAVLSSDPLSFDAFVRNDHWDFRALGGGGTDVRNDPLASLLDIARRMAGEAHFEYDAATYVVGDEIASNYGSGYYGSRYYGYGSYGYPHRYGFGVSFGYPGYYDPFCYDPFWGWSCGYRYGFGYSAYYFGRPYYYRSYYYQPFGYSRYGGAWSRGFGRSVAGTRFVIPRDRVQVTGIQPRRRTSFANPGAMSNRGAMPRGSRVAPRDDSRRGPSMSPRGGSSRGPSMSPRGGSSGRGPSVSRPSGGSRGSSGTRSGGGGGGGGRSGGGSRGGGGGRRP